MRLAVVQMDVKILDKARNLEKILDRIREAASQGAQTIIFPECALTGYCYDSLDEARPVTEPVPGPSTAMVASLAKELGCTAVVGMLELGNASGSGKQQAPIYNAAAVITPDGILGTYRKIHLPHLGIDRFVAAGDRPFSVFTTPAAKVGVNICYDCSLPEPGRVVKLLGAQLLAIPTNWPLGSGTWQHTCCVRATENHLIVAASDRVGEERGFRFDGHSQIVDLNGKVLAAAGEREETILYAEVDAAEADYNHLVRIPGIYEIDRLADRRPEMYAAVTKPK